MKRADRYIMWGCAVMLAAAPWIILLIVYATVTS
jgi:hypothetical protein